MYGYVLVGGYLLAALASGGTTLRWTGEALAWLWRQQPVAFTGLYAAVVLAFLAMLVAPRYRMGPIVRRVHVRTAPTPQPSPPKPGIRADSGALDNWLADLVTDGWGRSSEVAEVVVDEPDAEVIPFRPKRRRAA